MFYFRLNRILIHSNHRQTIFRRRDRTDIEIYCFVTTNSRPLPSLKGITATIEENKREDMIKRAVKEAIDSRVFTPVENVKDEHVLLFGDTGYVIYEDEIIPDDFHFQMVIIGSRRKQRNRAKMWEEVLQDKEFDGFVKSALELSGTSINPAVALGAEIGKYLTRFIARNYANKEDDQIGLVYQSWNRREHYPHGERKRDDNKDLTGNINYDYSLFGFERPRWRPGQDFSDEPIVVG